jgi:hypothetical protein
VAAQVDGDESEIGGERLLLAEEAAMRHQPVEQHERRPGALVAVSDLRSVRSGKYLQLSSPARPLKGACAGPARGLK